MPDALMSGGGFPPTLHGVFAVIAFGIAVILYGF
jgi:hypothetical protein